MVLQDLKLRIFFEVNKKLCKNKCLEVFLQWQSGEQYADCSLVSDFKKQLVDTHKVT